MNNATLIYLFRQDLDQYPASQIKSLAQQYQFTADNLTDLKWMIAIKHARQKAQMPPEFFTQDPYLISQTLLYMGDEELDNICQAHPDIRKHCEPEWQRRALEIDPNARLDAGQTWQQVYRRLRNLQTLQKWFRSSLRQGYTIEDLKNLEFLVLMNSDLTGVPPEIGELTNLHTLRLPYNKLTKFPREIIKFTKLENLDLLGNQLTEIPPEVGDLAQLKELDLGANKLTRLPPKLAKLDKLIMLRLAGNPLGEGMPRAQNYMGREKVRQALQIIDNSDYNARSRISGTVLYFNITEEDIFQRLTSFLKGVIVDDYFKKRLGEEIVKELRSPMWISDVPPALTPKAGVDYTDEVIKAIVHGLITRDVDFTKKDAHQLFQLIKNNKKATDRLAVALGDEIIRAYRILSRGGPAVQMLYAEPSIPALNAIGYSFTKEKSSW